MTEAQGSTATDIGESKNCSRKKESKSKCSTPSEPGTRDSLNFLASEGPEDLKVSGGPRGPGGTVGPRGPDGSKGTKGSAAVLFRVGETTVEG